MVGGSWGGVMGVWRINVLFLNVPVPCCYQIKLNVTYMYMMYLAWACARTEISCEMKFHEISWNFTGSSLDFMKQTKPKPGLPQSMHCLMWHQTVAMAMQSHPWMSGGPQVARFCQKRVRSPKGKGEGWELPSKGGNQARKEATTKQSPYPKRGSHTKQRSLS